MVVFIYGRFLFFQLLSLFGSEIFFFGRFFFAIFWNFFVSFIMKMNLLIEKNQKTIEKTATGELMKVFEAHSSGSITALEISPDNSLLISGGKDSNIFVWNMTESVFFFLFFYFLFFINIFFLLKNYFWIGIIFLSFNL